MAERGVSMYVVITDGASNVLDGADGEVIDAQATLDAFEQAVLARLAHQFPQVAEWGYRWESSNADLSVEGAGDLDMDIYEAARKIGDEVYEDGAFWRFPVTA